MNASATPGVKRRLNHLLFTARYWFTGQAFTPRKEQENV